MSLAPEAVTVDRSPAFASAVASLAAGGVVVITSGLTSLLALIFGVLGLGMLAAGLFVMNSRPPVSLGIAGVFVCVLLGGFYGAPAELLLVSMVGTIVAWDVGHNAITVGRQLGHGDHTRRSELAHIGATVLVGIVAATAAYAVFIVAPGGQPATALILLLVAGLFFAWAVRT